MQQLMISFDASRCSACMACIIACRDQNEFSGKTALRWVATEENGRSESTSFTSLSIACFHCGDAPCLTECPTHAIFRRAGSNIIDVNHELCIGCRTCLSACPFGAPKFLQDGKMVKCDMCYARILVHMRPACERTCPTAALQVTSYDDVSAFRDLE